jgi:uncharacterized protein (DUF488 family)
MSNGKSEPPIVFTIGYNGQTIESLTRILAKARVHLLVDVRSRPYSHFSQFDKENLQRVFGANYVWKGRALGGKSGHKEPGYEEAVKWLADEAAKGRTLCIMCMEKDPEECHRGMWIAVDLRALGVTVVHLGADDGGQTKF